MESKRLQVCLNIRNLNHGKTARRDSEIECRGTNPADCRGLEPDSGKRRDGHVTGGGTFTGPALGIPSEQPQRSCLLGGRHQQDSGPVVNWPVSIAGPRGDGA